MKRTLVGLLFFSLASYVSATQSVKPNWIHGNEPCSANTDPPFEVQAYADDTFIIRQNKCINYEAPFLYLMFGQDQAFLQDTGAAPAANSGIAFPVRETVEKIVDEWARKNGKTRMRLLVTHSHAHGDHIGGDAQFAGRPDTIVVGTKPEEVREFFGIRNWPDETATLDLGGRILDIVPIPGHEPSSIAVYDRRTKLLLTGDTLYPGRLYIREWPAFKASIDRLAAFVKSHEVSHVLGTHIEMTSKPGVDYPVRTTYQPDEHGLALKPDHIVELHEAIMKMKDRPVREVHNDFIIFPR